uniref:Uncharacterized protein n=2 Tax=Candidatus Kentrum sp. TUN TaxID=2126343 RepID=A0A450ZP93_9GAMM|nr:MAG: hypothetical protein BECKTUN1418D_GA0071000_10346 [Candidatus Kentron sp. TUN]
MGPVGAYHLRFTRVGEMVRETLAKLCFEPTRYRYSKIGILVNLIQLQSRAGNKQPSEATPQTSQT